MIKVLVVCEGPTESNFIRDILYPFFEGHNIFLTPSIVVTKVNFNSKNNTGGEVPYDKLKKQISSKLQDSSSYVTTFIDYYGRSFFKDDIDVELIEQKLYTDFNNNRFIPYIQMHEFEALLLSSPETIIEKTNARLYRDNFIREISAFNNAEEVNNSPLTAPSKRIERIYREYSKPVDGIRIAKDIGLQTILEKCPRFDNWINKIKNLPEIR